MAKQLTDSEIVAELGQSLGYEPEVGVNSVGHVVRLRITNKNLKALPNAVMRLCHLKWLDVSQNQLTSLPVELGQLTELRRLTLNYNQLEDLPDTLYHLPHLRILSILDNKLTKLPAEIAQLTELRALQLSGNRLDSIPDELSRLVKLRLLSIGINESSQIASCVFQLRELRILFLNNYTLDVLPKEIFQLSRMWALGITENKHPNIPAEVWQLVHLRLLSLADSQLTALPADIANLSGLRTLTLSKNQLTNFPNVLGQLATLRELYLNNNQLTSAPDMLPKLTSLRTLDLGNNQLMSVPANLSQLRSLQKLYLNNTQLTTLPDTFGQLGNLQTLDLNDNELTTLPDIFGQLESLQKLYLNNTQLTTLPNTFGQLGKLQTLDLSNNPLTTLPDTFGQLGKLQSLDLSNNSLTTLPDTFGQLGSLQTLHLMHTPLTTLPDTFGQLATLRELYLRNNELITLPPTFGQLAALRLLHLRHTPLTTLPDTFGQLGSLQTLYLRQTPLTTLPDTFGQLGNLQSLYLNENQLTSLPDTFGQLGSLQMLYLNENQLTSLPDTFGQLGSLQTLQLDNNPLRSLPDTLGQLGSLQTLHLRDSELISLPETFGQLGSLQTLYLNKNQLTSLPDTFGQLGSLQTLQLDNNPLTSLPDTFGQLRSLQTLYLNNAQLTNLPETFSYLEHLQELYLLGNQLMTLPESIAQLAALREFDLDSNQLSTLPESIGGLATLQSLYLTNNQLTTLPDALGQLTSLQTLYLDNNQLMTVPDTFGQLVGLQTLSLNDNLLTAVPDSLGNLDQLIRLNINNNPRLMTPPPEIVSQGTVAILEFLQERQRGKIIRYQSKLLVVGEGGTGKSSLLRTLRGNEFVEGLDTTHGIEVQRYVMPLPDNPIIPLVLHTWDFGGQEIYHATHQFFLTQRSLYLVVWNARLGVDQGRLDYWLKTIHVLAPTAPVLLVATHTDMRPPDLNLQLFKSTYPQIIGSVGVSNKNTDGFETLEQVLAEHAAQLPLMGQPWPISWIDVENNIALASEHHIDEAAFKQLCDRYKAMAPDTLGEYLHDLGKILYFRDDEILRNMIVLKPNWITKAISRVLTDEVTSERHGVLQHNELRRIWAHDDTGMLYEPRLYPVFLRLMERFDLSYQIEADDPGEHPSRSLIPQLLPFQPPIELPPWPEIPLPGSTQVEMRYELGFVPAGIMSWFIVRTHRYTRSLHWREGALLTYTGQDARAELNPIDSTVRIVVWGNEPYNFFTILMNTLDLLLARFEGLRVTRLVPCTCHWQRHDSAPCPRAFIYEDLIRRKNARRTFVECPEFLIDVPVDTLLYGIHASTDQQVMLNIQQGQEELKQKLNKLDLLDEILRRQQQQTELIARNFTLHWNLEMHKLEAECPNTFCLMPGDRHIWDPRTWIGVEYRLYLFCQHPPHPHMVDDSYPIRQPKEWWIQVLPWLKYAIDFLKFAVPLSTAGAAVYDIAAAKNYEGQIKLLEQMAESLPDLAETSDDVHRLRNAQTDSPTGPALRTLYHLLDQLDPSHYWQDLHRIMTPYGGILWLCPEHRKEYEARSLENY